jgi:hypothetical protein
MKHLFRSLIVSVGFLAVANGATSQAPPERHEGRHDLFSAVLKTHVRDGRVDYAGIDADARFEQYLSSLATTDPDTLSTSGEQLAFWINAYNAYTIKLIIDRMPLESIRDISLGLPLLFGPWSIDVALVGGEVFTLNHIEHDVLREKFHDPRIHFVLVCASIGCPDIRPEAYEGALLEVQLEEETRRFITDPAKNRFDRINRRVYLSRIFEWYESDFDEYGGGVWFFLTQYVAPDIAEVLRSGDYDLEYLPYDWGLNSQ